MKLHSNIIGRDHIDAALAYAELRGVFGSLTAVVIEAGSRSHKNAWEVYLRGDGTVSTRPPMNRTYNDQLGERAYAATWCQWGDFLACLFLLDPEMKAGFYKNGRDFHDFTEGTFRDVTCEAPPSDTCGSQRCNACKAVERRRERATRVARTRGAVLVPAHAPTQRDIVAEIERTIDAYERTRPGGQAEFHAPYGSQLGDTTEDPCGYRFVDDTAPTSLAEVLDDPLLDDDAPVHQGHYSLGGTWFCDTCNSPYCDLA